VGGKMGCIKFIKKRFMKKYFITIISLFLVLISCKTQKNIINQHAKQGIEGYVREYVGNFMPMLNRNHQPTTPPPPKPLATTVYIYEATNLKDVIQINHSPSYSAINTKLIATAQSDAAGYFKVNLSVGKYSLFIKQNGNFYANSFDDKQNIALVIVNEKVFTKVTVKADVNATY
jgi:hypothetical protein